MAVVKYCVVNPVRDLILVENECFRRIGRAVRYAMLVENGHTAYFVHSTSIMSLTGHSVRLGLRFSTNIMSLTGQFTTLFITTANFFSR